MGVREGVLRDEVAAFSDTLALSAGNSLEQRCEGSVRGEDSVRVDVLDRLLLVAPRLSHTIAKRLVRRVRTMRDGRQARKSMSITGPQRGTHT